MQKKIYISFLLVLLLGLVTGCKSSYPKEELEERLVNLCSIEAKAKVSVYVADSTLYTVLPLDNVIDKDLQLSKKTLDVIQNVILCSNRVAISTDAEIEFFVVAVYDPSKGIEIVFTQYIEDVRRWLLSNISRSDFFSRSLTDINMHPKGYVFNEESVKSITLPEFIARQVKSRVKKEMEKNVIMQILMNFEKMQVSFKKEEDMAYFEYFLFKIEKGEEIAKKKIGTMPNLVELIVSAHKDVCTKYKFTKYKGIVIRTSDDILFSSI